MRGVIHRDLKPSNILIARTMAASGASLSGSASSLLLQRVSPTSTDVSKLHRRPKSENVPQMEPPGNDEFLKLDRTRPTQQLSGTGQSARQRAPPPVIGSIFGASAKRFELMSNAVGVDRAAALVSASRVR